MQYHDKQHDVEGSVVVGVIWFIGWMNSIQFIFKGQSYRWKRNIDIHYCRLLQENNNMKFDGWQSWRVSTLNRTDKLHHASRTRNCHAVARGYAIPGSSTSTSTRNLNDIILCATTTNLFPMATNADKFQFKLLFSNTSTQTRRKPNKTPNSKSCKPLTALATRSWLAISRLYEI